MLTRTSTPSSGLNGPAAIHEIYGAGDHRGIVGCQERYQLGNLNE